MEIHNVRSAQTNRREPTARIAGSHGRAVPTRYPHLILAILFLPGVLFGRDTIRDDASPLVQRFPRSYHVVQELKLRPGAPDAAALRQAGYRQFVALPVPSSNLYQSVEHLRTSGGVLRTFPETKEQYLLVEGTGAPASVTLEYDLTVFRLDLDSDLLPDPPADPLSSPSPDAGPSSQVSGEEETRYLGDGYGIETNHPEIVKIADQAASGARDSMDYIRRAYRLQQKRLRWTDRGQYRNISETFQNGGGDCGALSRVLVSLLRRHGIPARYLSGGFLKDGVWNWHRWVEFYLPETGWVPADAAMFAPEGAEYIGVEDNQRFIFNRGLGLTLDADGFHEKIDGLQTYYTGNWRTGSLPQGKIQYDLNIKISLLKESQESSYYNDRSRIERLNQDLLERFNGRRQAKGLPPLRYSSILAEVAGERIHPAEASSGGHSGGQSGDLAAALKAKGETVTALYAWAFNAGYEDLHPERTLDRMVQDKTVLANGVSQMGLGYYYDSATGTHRYMILWTGP